MKPQLTNFVWNKFGKLIDVRQHNNMLKITNDHGDVRQMSIKKYKQSAHNVEAKAKTLIGQDIEYRTSQNTKNYSTDVWFSDVR